MSNYHIVIPARLNSSRLERKLLIGIDGKALIERTWDNSIKTAAKSVVVVTDSKEIFELISSRGGNAFMSLSEHKSGTDRIAEYVQNSTIPQKDIIINVQGDEPMFEPQTIDSFAEHIKANNHDYGSVCKLPTSNGFLSDRNKVKVALDKHNYAIEFSRVEIKGHKNYHHVGVYAYTKSFLKIFTDLQSSPLEVKRKLEQLRAIESGLKINLFEIDNCESFGIDTIEDLEKFKEYLNGK